MMKNIFYTLMTGSLLCACAGTKYQIEGHTSLNDLDGKKIYIKSIDGQDLNTVDSCEIIHGNFQMEGALDTVHMALLYLGDQSLMPLVLEGSPVTVCLADTAWRVTGTEMNDKLYEFLNKKNRLEAEISELPRRESKMMLDGKDEYEISQTLNAEFARIQKSYDRLVMDYVTGNFDNMISVGVFMMHTLGQQPVLTPQIEDIMSKATDQFKQNNYIQWYMQTAEKNMHAAN